MLTIILCNLFIEMLHLKIKSIIIFEGTFFHEKPSLLRYSKTVYVRRKGFEIIAKAFSALAQAYIHNLQCISRFYKNILKLDSLHSDYW